MKKTISILLTLLLFLPTALAVSAEASSEQDAEAIKSTHELTFAIDILKRNRKLIKTSVKGSEITFSSSDFKDALGIERLDSVTVTSLPGAANGVLKLGELDVVPGQTVSAKTIGELRFIPATAAGIITTFDFICNADTENEVKCYLYVLEAENDAPTSRSEKLYTKSNIAVFSSMSGYDRDGDALEFRIVRQPKKGTLQVLDPQNGEYKYTPAAGYTGSDSFTYMVVDRYGNKSEVATVSIRIEKQTGAAVYSDMIGDPAHYAALVLAERDIMSGEKIGDEMVFCSCKEVTREDFLVMAMKAAGYSPNVYTAAGTGFADEDNITPSHKNYIITACRMGIADGYETEDGLLFLPKATITQAEAAVIVCRILDLRAVKVDTLPAFSESDKVPAWAEDAVYALLGAKILSRENGELNAEKFLTRGDSARIIAAMIDYAR